MNDRSDSREARSDDGTETGGFRVDIKNNEARKVERDAMDTIGITAIDRRAIQRLEAASFGSHFSSGSQYRNIQKMLSHPEQYIEEIPETNGTFHVDTTDIISKRDKKMELAADSRPVCCDAKRDCVIF